MSNLIRRIIEKEYRRNSYKQVGLNKIMHQLEDLMEELEGVEFEKLAWQMRFLHAIFREVWLELKLNNKSKTLVIEDVGLLRGTNLLPFKELQCPEIKIRFDYEIPGKNGHEGSFTHTYEVANRLVIKDRENDIWLMKNYEREQNYNFTKEVVEPFNEAIKGVRLVLKMD